jgi:predicted Zn-dependent protease
MVMAMLLLSKREFTVAAGLALVALLLFLSYLRRLKLRRTIAATRQLVEREHWNEARSQLADALRRYPSNGVLLSLLPRIEQGLRAQEIAQRGRAVNELIAQGDWAQAQTLLDAALQSFPDEQVFEDLRRQPGL